MREAILTAILILVQPCKNEAGLVHDSLDSQKFSSNLDHEIGSPTHHNEISFPMSVADSSVTIWDDFSALLKSSISSAIYAVGSVVPLRGLASVAADFGVPGAKALISMLTPTRVPRLSPGGRGSSLLAQQEAKNREFPGQSFHDPLHESNDKAMPHWKQDLVVLIGAIQGEQDCVLKAACIIGKRVTVLTGITTLTLAMSFISERLHESVRPAYNAFRDSIMYSDDCQQYKCDIIP